MMNYSLILKKNSKWPPFRLRPGRLTGRIFVSRYRIAFQPSSDSRVRQRRSNLLFQQLSRRRRSAAPAVPIVGPSAVKSGKNLTIIVAEHFACRPQGIDLTQTAASATHEAINTMVIVPFPQNLSIIVISSKRAYAVATLWHFDGIDSPDRRSNSVAGIVVLGTNVEVMGTHRPVRTSSIN